MQSTILQISILSLPLSLSLSLSLSCARSFISIADSFRVLICSLADLSSCARDARKQRVAECALVSLLIARERSTTYPLLGYVLLDYMRCNSYEMRLIVSAGHAGTAFRFHNPAAISFSPAITRVRLSKHASIGHSSGIYPLDAPIIPAKNVFPKYAALV